MANPEQIASQLGAVVRHVGEKITSTGMDPSITGTASDGDIMTAADKLAANTVRKQLRQSQIPCALLMEETGELENIHERPEWIAIVDELDGSRPARLGLSAAGMCSVTAALIPIESQPTLGNIKIAASYSLSGDTYIAMKAGGITKNGQPHSSQQVTVETIADARIFNEHMGQCGLLEGMYKQIFTPANAGGHFYIASSSAAARFIIDGKADVHVHLGKRLRDRFPQWKKYLLGNGKPASMMPWDLGSYYLLLTEAGAKVTNGFGESIENLSLTGKGSAGQTSVISATTSELHSKILEKLDATDQFLDTNKNAITQLLKTSQ